MKVIAALASIYSLSGALLVGGAAWAMARMRRLDAAEIREEQTWALTEEWTPCSKCEGPVRPGRTCESCKGGV